ncbi:MAG: four helix bundle protein [Sedimentisphaerales bacterium]|nr:four helix bundle protein [Sedimentisphaerales bacterium]
MPRDFKNIKAWQYADDLVILVYSKTKSFPKEELYGVTSQLRRAVVSVPTNIAEGASREHKKEYLHFLYIAKGSIAEVEYLLHLSRRIGYFKDDEYKQMEDRRQEAAKTLHGLINSVKKDINKIECRS